MLGQALQVGDVLGAGEVAARPLFAALALAPPQVALLVLDQALVVRDRVHVAARDRLRHLQPRPPALDLVLVADVRHLQLR